MEKNTFYISTGTFVGKLNNYNFHEIVRVSKQAVCSGFEFMMLPAYVGNEKSIAKELLDAKIDFPTFHMDKYIGMHLENGDFEQAKKIFKENVEFAKMLNSKKLILHLWFGDINQENMQKVFACEKEFEQIASPDLLLTIENVPSLGFSPLYLWKELYKVNPNVKFTYDTRFGTYYNENEEIFNSIQWNSVEHVHISSFSGTVDKTKRLIRPILHPGEGVPDFKELLSKMPSYKGSVTLESPVLREDGYIDIDKLNSSIQYLKEYFEKYNK